MSKLIIIPGAQKSGTTTLYKTISNTFEQVSAQEPKECHIFSLKEKPNYKMIDWYKSRILNTCNNIFIDASTSYLNCPSAPARMQNYFPSAKIIIILRDPARRVFSGLQHSKKKFESLDGRDPSEYTACVEQRTNDTGLFKADSSCLNQALEKGTVRSDYFGRGYLQRRDIAPFEAPLWDPNWQFKYFQVSMYSRGIKRFKEEFEDDQIRIVILEELLHRTDHVMENLAAFLDLELCTEGVTLPHGNKTTLPRNRVARAIGWLRHNAPGLRQMLDWGVRSMPNFIRGLRDTLLMGTRPTLTPELYRRMRNLLKNQYAFVAESHPQIKDFWT